MKNKLFLTGERGAGKSTLINRFAQMLDFVPCGFQTLPCEAGKNIVDTLIIRPYDANLPLCGELEPDAEDFAVVAIRNRQKRTLDVDINAFDKTGVEILRRALVSAHTRFIIMDELGFMESEAYLFQYEVFRCLDSRIPVLGVLRAASTPFLDAVRMHDNVTVVEVTLENREQVFEKVLDIEQFCR